MDPSDVGVGGAILQNGQRVAFYSNTLTETEQRYAMIEKECLPICLAFEKWDSLLYGKSDITVQTDHQQLESIFKKPLNKAPGRLQAMRIRLQRWSFGVKYKKRGTSHRRHPVHSSSITAFLSKSLRRTDISSGIRRKYKKGAQQIIANTLSRAPLPQLSTVNLSGEQIFLEELEAMALDNSGISKVIQ